MIYLLKLTVSLSLGNKLKVYEIMYVSGSHFVINKEHHVISFQLDKSYNNHYFNALFRWFK